MGMKGSTVYSNVPSRLPAWLRKRVICGGSTARVTRALKEFRLKTVCREASCPNLMECFARGSATFIILGDNCTRNCGFCGVKKGPPRDVEEDEPERLTRAAKLLGLHHVVITSVTRDDLPDGGSGHFSRVIHALKKCDRQRVEVLVPDFQGVRADIHRVLDAGPHVFAHNVETVPRLYPRVRPEARYERSLRVLDFAGEYCQNGRQKIRVKSGLMLGLGERKAEVLEVLKDLLHAGCETITIGQYLRPSRNRLPVERYLAPTEFQEYEEMARALGFLQVFSGPFVRSSYCIV